MLKFKHNKKRNTAILYEVLILELTKAILHKDEQLRQQLVETIKTSFSKNTILGQELKLYRTFTETKGLDRATVQRIMDEAKKEHEKLNKEKLAMEHNQLNFKMKKMFPSSNVFSNFVPNYKTLASISQIFNKDASVKARVLLENEVIDQMSSELLTEDKMVPIDNLVFSTFTKKFNESYSSTLCEEQKTLLNKYITSFTDRGVGLKLHMDGEIGRLKKGLNESLTKEAPIDESAKSSVKEVLKLLETMKERPIDKEMVEQVLKIQALLREIKN